MQALKILRALLQPSISHTHRLSSPVKLAKKLVGFIKIWARVFGSFSAGFSSGQVGYLSNSIYSETSWIRIVLQRSIKVWRQALSPTTVMHTQFNIYCSMRLLDLDELSR